MKCRNSAVFTILSSNGIAYAGEPAPVIKVSGVRPLNDHQLWICFNPGDIKIFDFAPQIAFAPLADEDVFQQVFIDYGVTVWLDGNIDIAPETLYAQGQSVEEENSA